MRDSSVEDSDDVGTTKDFLRKRTLQREKEKEASTLVTFDFKGRILKIKNSNLNEKADVVSVVPEVRISRASKGSISQR